MGITSAPAWLTSSTTFSPIWVCRSGESATYSLSIWARSHPQDIATSPNNGARSRAASSRRRRDVDQHEFGLGYIVVEYVSSTSASSLGWLSAAQWPPSISSGVMPKRAFASRRRRSGGKKRSSRHTTNFVGTSGHALSGHGAAIQVLDCPRSLLIASSANTRGTPL